MKTLHTIYTNFAKRVLMALALITMGVSTAWGEGIATLPVDYNFSSGKNHLPDGVTHKGLGSDYAAQNSPYLLKFDDNGDYIQVQVNGAVGKIIFEVKMLGGNSTSYFQLQGSSDGTSFDDIEKFTISGAQDDVITCTTSENIDDSYRYFKFLFTKGSNVGFGKLQLLEVGNNNCEATYDFVNNLDFNTWDTKYTKRVLNYIDAQVIFESADKQQSGSTIADRPVTKGQPVSLVMTDGSTLSAVEWVCKQWDTKTQTITLHYSTDGGESYTSIGVTSTNFTISSDNLPAGTNAVKITFSSSSNQVGITSCSIKKVCGPTETTITLHPNGGTPNENQEITTEEESYTLPECPFSRTGYTFDGWATSANGNVIYENKETIENLNGTAVNLYAKWTPIQYAITYNLNGGTNHASNPAKYTIETSIITLQAPTKTGYTFGGWYKEDAFTTPFTQITNGSTGDITLYAKWTPNTYTVQFDSNEGTGEMEEQSFTYDAEPTSLSANIFERVGYNFNSWNTAQDGTGTRYNDKAEVQNLTAAANGVVTLYAQWTAKKLINYRTLCEYEVTWLIDENPYIDGTPTTTVQAGKTITTLPTNPTDNALGCCSDKFMGWTTSTAKTIEDQYLYETIEEIQAKFPSIYEDLTFRAVFATTAQGVGTSIADFSEMGYENNTAVTDPIILGDGEGHGDATITLAKAQSSKNDAKYYDDGEAVRVYAGSTITISSTYNGATIKSVTFEFSTSDNEGENTISVTSSDGTYSEGTWTGDATAVTFTIGGSTGHRRIASIIVTTGVSGSQYTNYVTKCTLSDDASLGEGTIQYANEGTAIAVNCGRLSSKNSAATLTFPDAQYLTCPITLTASNGFVLSTNKSGDAYAQTIKVTPYKEGLNSGKLRTIYIRANAEGKTENFNGTITITGGEITDQSIAVSAIVNCQGYTFTLIDHLGNTIGEVVSYYEGETIENVPDKPAEDACSGNYTFAGWSESAVEYGSLVYDQVTFPYTMPGHDVTLYPVYECNKTADYHRVTYDLENNWAGDYLIAYSDNIFANGKVCGTDGIGKASNYIDLSKDISNNTINYLQGDEYKVTLEKYNEGYLLKTQDGEYNYYTNISNDNMISTSAKASTAGNYALDIKFESADDIKLCLSGAASGSVFGYRGGFFRYFILDTRLPIYLYKKSPLYTTSLICGEISVEEDNVVVTSTKDQKVKVNVPIKVSSYYNEVVNVEGVGESTFSVSSLNDVTVNTDETINLELTYSPSEYDHLDNETITLTASNGATTTFQVKGRSLPENFVIAAKVGNVWYALPSQGLNSETTPVGYPVEVDNNDNPTAVTAVPDNADWSLRQVYASPGSNDRFTANGENLVFVNAENKTLYASKENANIQTFAEYTNYAAKNPDRYEWVPTTTDLTNYTLKNVGRDKDLSINVNATFGTHASNIASNNLRFLPINATYNPFDMQVVEWYPTKVLVQTEAALTSVSATVGGIAVANPVVTKKGGKLYEISGLPLESNPTKILTISYDTYSCSKVIPIIISREKKTVTDAPFSTLTMSAYNYSDLVVRDGATLTINGTKQAPDKFVNVTIYPTAKIVVPENKQLSVYSLTFFGGIDDIYDGEKYTTNKYGVPQFSLKGTLGKTVTTMDYIMRVNTDQMYSLGVPYDVALEDIKYWDGSAIGLGTQLYVSAYDGQARANREKKTWIYETDFKNQLGSATLKAGVGYTISAEPQVDGDTYSILRMPMKNNINSGATEGEKKVNVVAYDNQKGMTITDNHKGWNLVGNPYMTTITGADDDDLVLGYLQETGSGPWEWVEKTYRYVTIPADNGKDYSQQKFTDAVLPPFKNFFVQVGTTGELMFDLGTRQSMPARSTQAAIEKEVEFEILMSNDTRKDNTGLLISEEYSPAYEINADLEKMIGSMSVYTIYGGYKLAYNALSPINASEWIPMGYVAPAAGEYTLSLDDVENIAEQVEHVYIIDYNANNIVDLMDEEYKFTTDKEQNDNRFAINVVLVQDKDNTTTGLDMIQGNNAAPIKFIYHDKMYIQSGGVIYDGTGKQVTNINK